MNTKNEELFEKLLKEFKEKFAPNGIYFEQFIDCDYDKSFRELVSYNKKLCESYQTLLIRDGSEKNSDEEELKTNNRRFYTVQNEYKKAFYDMMDNVYYPVTNYLISNDPTVREDWAYGQFK